MTFGGSCSLFPLKINFFTANMHLSLYLIYVNKLMTIIVLPLNILFGVANNLEAISYALCNLL